MEKKFYLLTLHNLKKHINLHSFFHGSLSRAERVMGQMEEIMNEDYPEDAGASMGMASHLEDKKAVDFCTAFFEKKMENQEAPPNSVPMYFCVDGSDKDLVNLH